jgi:hypothetical protein
MTAQGTPVTTCVAIEEVDMRPEISHVEPAVETTARAQPRRYCARLQQRRHATG